MLRHCYTVAFPQSPLISTSWYSKRYQIHCHNRMSVGFCQEANLKLLVELALFSNSPRSIYQNSNIANCSRLHCFAIPKRDLSTKKTKPNIEKWPESLGVMSEFLYIERGLLSLNGSFFLCIVPGGGYSWEFLVGVCRQVLQTLTQFQTKKC